MYTKITDRRITPSGILSTGTHYTNHIDITNATGASFHIIWEGTPDATVELQTSNDPNVTRPGATPVWFTESTSITGPDGATADSSDMVHLDNVNSSYARLKFTVTTAGDGTNVYATTKE